MRNIVTVFAFIAASIVCHAQTGNFVSGTLHGDPAKQARVDLQFEGGPVVVNYVANAARRGWVRLGVGAEAILIPIRSIALTHSGSELSVGYDASNGAKTLLIVLKQRHSARTRAKEDDHEPVFSGEYTVTSATLTDASQVETK